MKECCQLPKLCRKRKEEDEQEVLFSAIAESTEVKLMCIEAKTVLDLCELYPKTAQRLRWLAIKRREELQAILRHKNQIKTWVPTRW